MSADMEIAEKRHASEREASEMYQRTLAQSDELMARAEALLSDAGTRAREITTQVLVNDGQTVVPPGSAGRRWVCRTVTGSWVR